MRLKAGFIMKPIVAMLFFVGIQNVSAQITMSPESGYFGVYGGVVRSNLSQILPAELGLASSYYQGFEAGIKNEMYRGQWLKGLIYASYMQYGAKEFGSQAENFNPVNVDLKAIKIAFDPIIGKVGGDFFHGYAGGGIFGSYFLEQSITGMGQEENHWSTGKELDKTDFGLDLLAGIHVWNFDVEFHAQYGNLALAQRMDGSEAKQKFYSLTLTYMFIDRNITRRSCRDKDR